MAQHRLGNAEKAHAALANAKAIVSSKMPKPEQGQPIAVWYGWLQTEVVLREAEALAKKK